MTITQHYRQQIDELGYHADPEQAGAITAFQRLYDELNQRQGATGLLDRLLSKKPPAPLGLYLWGGPGRGKTYLMDLFYYHLPLRQKQRLHFHRFMQNIHTELASLGQQRGPLRLIGKQVAEETRILCLDEFYVADIGDAMLLAGLLEAIFENGVVLVTTSNTTPDNLYRNGLQRDRFLPAIELIKQHTELIEMRRGGDYRLQTTSDNRFQRYSLCSHDEALSIMAARFERLTGARYHKATSPLLINDREIALVARHDDLIWFDFKALCESNRATTDYLQIADRFRQVMITHIPVMDEALDSAAIRFIHLIDALYDRRVELITTAAAMPEALYHGRHHLHSFKRAASRLREMEHYDVARS